MPFKYMNGTTLHESLPSSDMLTAQSKTRMITTKPKSNKMPN